MFIKFIAWAWLLSIFLSVTVAVDRGEPIVEALKPIKRFQAFIWQLILVAWIGMLVVLEIYGCPDLLGQRPIYWCYFMLVVYSWVCLGNYYASKD